MIRHTFAGGVYRAVDHSTGETVIVKQARRHTAATTAGGDAHSLRRHEAAMLDEFAGSGFTARPVAVFEQQGDLFLVQEAIVGATLRRWVLDHMVFDDGGSWGPDPDETMAVASRLTELMRAVHHKGWVLRDFNPNNVMVAGEGTLRLIDLETLARPGEPVQRVHTPGYAAAEQVNAERISAAPRTESDLYSLGATLFYLATGVDPLLASGDGGAGAQRERLVSWLGRLSADNPAARRLAPLVRALLDDDPAARLALDEVLNRLQRAQAGPARSRPAPASRRIGEGELKQLVTDGLDHLIATMAPERSDRLWPSGPVGAVADPFNVQHGAAGCSVYWSGSTSSNRSPRCARRCGAPRTGSAGGWAVSPGACRGCTTGGRAPPGRCWTRPGCWRTPRCWTMQRRWRPGCRWRGRCPMSAMVWPGPG
ncbi:protein kinase domain-containing protein [Streptomyces lasalocidi]